jgi:hypothetical protein
MRGSAVVEETANVSGFSVTGGRRAQIEMVGLLDKCDSDLEGEDVMFGAIIQA